MTFLNQPLLRILRRYTYKMTCIIIMNHIVKNCSFSRGGGVVSNQIGFYQKVLIALISSLTLHVGMYKNCHLKGELVRPPRPSTPCSTPLYDPDIIRFYSYLLSTHQSVLVRHPPSRWRHSRRTRRRARPTRGPRRRRNCKQTF